MSGMADAVRRGLTARPKALPPRFFYDARGSELFERICELPEYYLTRTEDRILAGLGSALPSCPTVVELGGGSATKTRRVLEAVRARRYVGVDISRSALETAAEGLRRSFPGLAIEAVEAEYAEAIRGGRLPKPPALAMFLGSNIGNFDPEAARSFLRSLNGYRLLVGFDLQKDPAILHAAYNDSAGVTAEFNLNLLARINRELKGEFDLSAFSHRAFYAPGAGRIEMHLVSRLRQEVRIRDLDLRVEFEAGETIHTENSYKFSRGGIEDLAQAGGFRIDGFWTDEKEWFAVALLSATPERPPSSRPPDPLPTPF
jgi:dimethylhistidine N-methyltransferase